MAASNTLLRLVKRMIHERQRGMQFAGTLPTTAVRDLQELKPGGYQSAELFLTPHSVTSRFDSPADRWTEERIVEAIETLLHSSHTRGMPNFIGGNRTATEALIVPDTPKSLFAPVFSTKEGGHRPGNYF